LDCQEVKKIIRGKGVYKLKNIGFKKWKEFKINLKMMKIEDSEV